MHTVLYILGGTTLCFSGLLLIMTRSRLHKIQIYQEIRGMMPKRSFQVIAAFLIMLLSFGIGTFLLHRFLYSLLLSCLLNTPWCYYLLHSLYIDSKKLEIDKSSDDYPKVIRYAQLYRRCSLVCVISLVLMQLTLFL